MWLAKVLHEINWEKNNHLEHSNYILEMKLLANS